MHRWLNTRAKSPRDACFRALVDYFGTHLLEHHLRKARHVMRGAKEVEVCGEFRYLIKMADLLAHRAVGIVFVDHHPPCDVSAHNRGNCQNVPHVKSKAVKKTRARARGGSCTDLALSRARPGAQCTATGRPTPSPGPSSSSLFTPVAGTVPPKRLSACAKIGS